MDSTGNLQSVLLGLGNHPGKAQPQSLIFIALFGSKAYDGDGEAQTRTVKRTQGLD